MTIDTARMALRPVTAADSERLADLDSDPEVMRYVSGGAPTPRSFIEDWVIPLALNGMRTRPGVGIWVAVDRSRGEFLGWLSLRAPRHSNQPELELTYRFRRIAWGQGLATESARAMVTLAFDELGTNRLFAGTTAANRASRRVMEKSGMRLAAFRQTALHQPADSALDRAERDEVEYEILRNHWETENFPWANSALTVSHLIA